MPGPPSSVWSRFGLIASVRSAAIAPATLRSSAVIGRPSRVVREDHAPEPRPQVGRSDASASTAMTSDATVITNSVSRG